MRIFLEVYLYFTLSATGGGVEEWVLPQLPMVTYPHVACSAGGRRNVLTQGSGQGQLPKGNHGPWDIDSCRTAQQSQYNL
jgi:hypothetical protein